MAVFALLIALLALVVGVAALMLAVRKGPPQIVRYRISGGVEVINDCDGNLASVPNQVKISTALNDAQGQASGGSQTVNLAPDPNDPPNTPRKIGSYDIRVPWGPGFGNPTHWDTPVATLPNGRDICRSINCPVGGGLCRDTATRPARVAFANPSTHDVRVQCNCT